MDKINECIIVAAKKHDGYILVKNRDRRSLSDYKVYHNLFKGVELAYAEDTTGWAEGMSEYVGFVYTYFMNKEASSYYKYRSKWGVQSEITIAGHNGTKETDNSKRKRDEFKTILTFKTAEKAAEYIRGLEWNGAYFVCDKDGVYEIEHFQGETEVRRCNFLKSNFKVKTNYGNIIKTAGHLDGVEGTARGNAEVRKTETERYLLGFKNTTDILKKMQQRTFTDSSSLNVFRVDDEERTVGQLLIDMNNKIFQFVHHDENSTFHGLVKDLPKGYDEKLHIFIRNKKEFDRGGELNQFKQKANDLYSHYKTFKVDF